MKDETDFEVLTTHYMDNDPNGVRVCMKDNSLLSAYIIPAHLLSRAKQLGDDIKRHGVYFLIDDRDDMSRQMMYAGKTENGILRLFDHKSDKNKHWSLAVLFLADDHAFNLDVIRALETKAIQSIKDSKRYESDNKKEEKFEIGIYKRQTVNRFFADIKFIMESLGYGLDAAKIGDKGEWHTSRRGIVAYGRYANGKFDLLPGSQIDMTHTSCSETYLKLRRQLVDKGYLVKDKDGSYILKTILSFKSPSGASDFVMGSSTDGWEEWKNDKGVKLDVMRK